MEKDKPVRYQEKAKIYISISDEIEFKEDSVIRSKEGCFIFVY